MIWTMTMKVITVMKLAKKVIKKMMINLMIEGYYRSVKLRAVYCQVNIFNFRKQFPNIERVKSLIVLKI